MPTLDIPKSGLSFESVSETSSKSATQDIIGLTLTDDLIEEMIQCVQNGKQISLSLGPRPVRIFFLGFVVVEVSIDLGDLLL
jgi:RNA polymerase II elongation factor ELL